jgi:hypothetical protein
LRRNDAPVAIANLQLAVQVLRDRHRTLWIQAGALYDDD